MATIFSTPRSNLEQSPGEYSLVLTFVHTCRREVLRGPVVFPQSDQDVAGGEVLVPGRVEDAVSGSEDPLVADQTGSTQQLLGAPLVQHHLPAGREPGNR